MGRNSVTSVKWKYVQASVKGTSHEGMAVPCQDNNSCTIFSHAEDNEVLVAVASDGAGSAQKSELGAALVCSSFTKAIEKLIREDGSPQDVTRKFADDWLTHFQQEITLQAEFERLETRD